MNKEKYLSHLTEIEDFLTEKLEETCSDLREIIQGIEDLEKFAKHIAKFKPESSLPLEKHTKILRKG